MPRTVTVATRPPRQEFVGGGSTNPATEVGGGGNAGAPEDGTASDRTAAAFEAWGYQEAAAAVSSALAAMPGGLTAYAENKAVAESQDHWRGGEGWAGPDGGGEEAVWVAMRGMVEKSFAPVDVSGEVLTRAVNGVLRREAAVAFTPRVPEGEKGAASPAQVAEAEAVLRLVSRTWDRVRYWEHLRQATRRSRYAPHGPLRVSVVPTALVTAAVADEQGEPTAETVTGLPADLLPEEAFGLLAVDAPLPESAVVWLDPETHRECAVFLFEEPVGTDAGRPLPTGSTPQTVKKAEIWWLDVDAPTEAVVRVVTEHEAGAVESVLLTGGALPIATLPGDLLLTDVVRRLNRALNFANTVVPRTVEVAGFPERYTLNASPVGLWLREKPVGSLALKEKVEHDGTRWYLHEVSRPVGGAIVNDLRGFDYITGVDAMGNETHAITTPGVEFREPTDPAFAIRGVEHLRAMILQLCHQAHVLDSNAATSGYSKEQARADFAADLDRQRAVVEGAVRQSVAALVGLAAGMTREGTVAISEAPNAPVVDLRTFLERYDVAATVYVNAGPLSPEEQDANSRQVKDGLLSAEEAMTRNNVENVQATRDAIRTDPMYLAELRLKQFTALQAANAATADLEGAAILLGLTPAEARSLLRTDAEGDPAQNGGVTQ